MRHRQTSHPIAQTPPSRTDRRSASATAAQLRREQARHLAWFNL